MIIENGVTANGDARLLEVALQNLLDNAWKFTSKQKHAQTNLAIEKKDGCIIYLVRDNGTGFGTRQALDRRPFSVQFTVMGE